MVFDSDKMSWAHNSVDKGGLGIVDLWNLMGVMGEGVKVAVIDTGILKSHQDIKKNNIILTKNFLYTGDDKQQAEDVTDNVGHGTHCAGIIAAQGIKSQGIAPNVNLLIGKISDTPLGIDSSLLFNGIEWAYKNGADVISVSITVDSFADEYQKEIQNLDSNYKGILVGSLTDIGDLGFDSFSFPTCLNACIGVGAINKNLQMDEVTARSSYLDVLAPGREVFSTWNDGSYKSETGCSMATPFVAGVIALILSSKKNIPKQDIINAIKTNANNFTSYASLPTKKYPIIDPLNILTKLKTIL